MKYVEFLEWNILQKYLAISHDTNLYYMCVCVCVCVCVCLHTHKYMEIYGFPQWLSGKESACNADATGDAGSIPESGRSPGGGHGNPLQYSFLESRKDRAAWWVIVHRVAKSRTQLKQLSSHACM